MVHPSLSAISGYVLINVTHMLKVIAIIKSTKNVPDISVSNVHLVWDQHIVLKNIKLFMQLILRLVMINMRICNQRGLFIVIFLIYKIFGEILLIIHSSGIFSNHQIVAKKDEAQIVENTSQNLPFTESVDGADDGDDDVLGERPKSRLDYHQPTFLLPPPPRPFLFSTKEGNYKTLIRICVCSFSLLFAKLYGGQ